MDKVGRESRQRKRHIGLVRRSQGGNWREEECKGKEPAEKEREEEEGVEDAEEVQQGACNRCWTMRGKMAYGGDGLPMDGETFYRGMLRSVKGTHFKLGNMG